MKGTRKRRAVWARFVSVFLTISMIAPQIAPLAAYAAQEIRNTPRKVDFSRPEALTLEDVSVASDSNAWNEGDQKDPNQSGQATGTAPTVKPDRTEEELRGPEEFYEEFIEEPEGTLVRFSNAVRTYEVGDRQYVSVMGGYSGLYLDENGKVRRVDNTLVAADGDGDDSDEETPETASPSNARLRSRKAAVPVYENEAGGWKVRLPERMTQDKGVTLEAGEHRIEMIPTEGSFKKSLAAGSAIRYNDVFKNVDIQYTLVGNSLKEDIILLEKGDRNQFSYRLKTGGLKAREVSGAVQIYEKSVKEPVFTLSAPVMTDGAGEISPKVDIDLKTAEGGYVVTITADKKWLNAEDRVYPVRIDPDASSTITKGPEVFKMVSVSSANPDTAYGWTKPVYVGYDDGSNSGNSPAYENCRAYVSLGSEEEVWNDIPRDVEISRAEFSIGQQTGWSGGASSFVLEAPNESWNINMTWNQQKNLTFTPVGAPVSAVGPDQVMTFEMTDIMKKWLAGTKTQVGLAIRAEAEPPSSAAAQEFHHPCEVLYNYTNPTYGPKLTWYWEGDLPPALEAMDINDLEVRLDPIVQPGDYGSRTSLGVLVYGRSQIDSKVTYTRKDDEVSGEATAEAECIYPDYSAGGRFPEVFNDDVKNSNWQGEPHLEGDGLELDTIYHYIVKADGVELVENPETGEPELGTEPASSEEIPTDKFLLYRVQASDILPRIAKHYGVEFMTILEDNRLPDQLTVENDVLFIRNPQTDEPYTRDNLTDLDMLLIDYLLRGRQLDCEFNHEPINMSTGNFYMEQTDAEMPDLGGSFGVYRSYNSVAAYFRSAFGTGWNSPFDERLMMLRDGRVFYLRGDGSGMAFETDGDGTYRAPAGFDLFLEASGDQALRIATASNAIYNEETGELPGDEEGGTESDVTEDPGKDSEIDGQAEGWKLTDKAGNVKYFNCYGLLLRSIDRNGNETVFEYESDKAEETRLKSITSPAGKVFEVTMDEENRITAILLPDGTELSYGYDENDDLVSFTNQEGHTIRYEYDDSHHMTAWYDANGTRIVKNTYDDQGRVVRQEDAEGGVARLEYQDGCTVSRDNLGNVTKYYYDGRGRSTKVEYADGTSVKTRYDEAGRAVSRTDELGVETAYAYDENGNVLSVERADGAEASFTYNEWNQVLNAVDFEGNETRFTYDENGNLLTASDGEGNTVSYTYDESGRVLTVTDGNGGVTSLQYEGAVVTAMTGPEGNETSWTYDAMNRVLTETNPLGHERSWEYNRNGWKIRETEYDGAATAYEFSPAGEVLSITDPSGAETRFTYDKLYHILSGEDALGNTLRYEYDKNYNKIRETDALGNETVYGYNRRGRLSSVTDALGNTVSYSMDGAGRLTAVRDRRGNRTEAEYDPVLGLPILTRDELGNATRYTYNSNGDLIKTVYPDGGTATMAYDRAGRPVKFTNQSGLVTEISYDGNGNMTRVRDDESRVYTFEYDGNNRLIRSVNPLGGVKLYGYDGAGNRLSETDENGNTTGSRYDPAGRLKELLDAAGGSRTVDYNVMGQAVRVTDPNGGSTAYFYDAIGQMTASENALGHVSAWEYDPLGNMVKATDPLKGETAYTYDALSRAGTVTDAMGHEFGYVYDENGNLVEMAMPDGDTVVMAYDAKNQMTESVDEAGVVTSYVYDSMGRIVKASDTAGNVMTYEYDRSGHLIKQTDTIGRSAVFRYDRFGRLESVTGADQATTAYAYDALDRLTSVTQADGTVFAYEYDPAGNLVKTTEPGEAVYTYTYDVLNRLTDKVNPLGAATVYQYDPGSNLTASVDAEGVTVSYAYDALNRLTSITDGKGGVTAFEYDELSRLLSYGTPEGNKEEYRYDPDSNLTKKKDANGLITEFRYDVMGNLLEEISPKGAKTSYTYDKHDELTSVTDAAGNVTRYEVDMNRLVTKMTQRNGGEYSYTYDAVHRLTEVATPLGLKTTFAYDDGDNVVMQADSLNRIQTFEYDIMHRMTRSVNAEGGITNYGYDIRGNRNQLTDALGYTWNYRYDLVDQLTSSVDPEGKATEFAYNLVGELSSVTKPGQRQTSLQYDENYNVTGIADPMGYVYHYSYDKDNRRTGTGNPLGETTAAVYDPGSRIVSVTDRMGLTEKFTYDPHGNVTAYQGTDGRITGFGYDIVDNLVKVTMPSGLTASYAYDEMGNVISATDTMFRTTQYTYDLEGNMTSITDPSGRKETMGYDEGGRITGYTSNGGNTIRYDYDKLNGLVEKSYEDARDPEQKEGVLYGYDVMGQRRSMMDRSGESSYEYDGLGRITKVVSGSGEATVYRYDGSDQLESITYPDGKKVSYRYDKNDNLIQVTDRTGAVTTYVYDAINRVTEIHRPNGVSTYHTYNARDQITDMKNVCDDCDWTVSEYHYTYDDRGFIVGEDVTESLYAYAWDDKHDGKHENWHDDKFPHGDKHYNKHDKDGIYNFQIIGTKRSFEYDEDGKLVKATEKEDRQGTYVYEYAYDDMGNRTLYKKSRNGVVKESAEYSYNLSNQMTAARLYDGKHYKNVEYSYDADGNRVMQEEIKDDGERKVELSYDYTVENRLKAVSDKKNLLVAMAYDGDGNRIFQLNYNLHTDDDWKGNSGNGNGNNKDNTGSGNSGNSGNGSGGNGKGAGKAAETSIETGLVSGFGDISGTGFGSAAGSDGGGVSAEEEPGFLSSLRTLAKVEQETFLLASDSNARKSNGNKDKDKGNDGNDKNNGKGNGNKGNGNGNSGNNGNGNGNSGNNGNGNGNSGNNGNGNGNSGNNGNGNGNTNNTGGSQNQSGILFPIDGEVSELEEELIGLIKTSGKHKNYELVEYVNDVNREYTEVLMELNINGIMDTAYSYGNERLTNERFTGWTGYYTYDPRGSVSGVTDREGMIWQSYRYDANGSLTFGKPQYNNVYGYNAESYNPNVDVQYLRARYYSPGTANFLTEDSYLGNLADPLTLNRYNYVKSSPLNFIDPSGMTTGEVGGWDREFRDERRKQLAGDSNGLGIIDILKENVDEYGRVHIGNIGNGKDRIALYMQIADESGEINWCQAAKQMVSFALGMEGENRSYWNSSDFQKSTWTRKLAKNLVDGIQKLLFGRSFSEYVEEKLVDQYLDPEMYYTGKYISSLQHYVQASTNKSTLDSVLEYLGDHASELYVDTVLAAVGAMAGFSGSVPQMGMAGGAAAGTVSIEGAGAAVLVVGKGLAVGVAGGAVVYFSNEDNLNRSLDHAEKNKEKIDKAKGDSKTPDFDTSKLTRSQQKAIESADNIINNHLKESDLSAALGDLQGNPIEKPNGGYWNHAQEVKDAYPGLVRAQKTLEGSLKNPNLDLDVKNFIQSKYDSITNYINIIEDLFAPYGGIN